MQVRWKDNHERTGHADRFNVAAVAEVIVHFDDGSADSVYVHDIEVQVGDEWMTLGHALGTRAVITDNHNSGFFEPKTEADRERGYTL